MSKPMDPTRFTRTSTRTALKQMGAGIMVVQDADIKAVVAGVAAVEGTSRAWLARRPG